jgi:hypothetical protein
VQAREEKLAYMKRWRRDNPERFRAGILDWNRRNPQALFAMNLWKNFRIRFEKFSEMLIEQSGRCGICEKPLNPPCVDHNRKCCPGPKSCGKCVRGLLCRRCNTSLHEYEDRKWREGRRISPSLKWAKGKRREPTISDMQ